MRASALELELQNYVREMVNELVGNSQSIETEFISIREASKICDCDESIIQSLVKARLENDFPAAVLGKKTIRIDKQRLYLWLRNGGLINGAN